MEKNNMNIIGFSLGFNSSAALVSTTDGVLCAISEERLNREKNTKRLPFEAIIACCEQGFERVSDGNKTIDRIAYSHYEDLSFEYLKKNCTEVEFKFIEALDCDGNVNPDEALFHLIKKYLKNRGFNVEATELERVEHHAAHRASNYFIYKADHPIDNAVVDLIADGFGDGYSSSLYINDSGKSYRTRVVDSVALVYQFFTGALGFKEHQHEGKVTGLAAHCERPEDNFVASRKKAIEICERLIWRLTGKSGLDPVSHSYKVRKDGRTYHSSGYFVDVDKLLDLNEDQKEMVKKSTIIDFDQFLRLKNTVYAFVKEYLGPDYNKDLILDWINGTVKIPDTMKATPWELAYAVQYFAEIVMLNFINLIDGNDNTLFLSGGLVANVKLNQRIKDTGKFKNIFVCPPMGDEGTALGAATAIAMPFLELKNTARTGPEVVINGGTHINYDKSLEDVINEAKSIDILEVFDFTNNKSGLIDKVTDLLKDEKIVHWCQQYEEYGPRALMNHSTLYTAQDPNGTHTLNQAMGRSEYMPYCPVCKNTSADQLFDNWEPGEESCRFMAMTMNCKPGVRDKYRGGVHVDNTARAQFVYEEDEWTKDAWNILDSYEKKTGNLMLINTSFNIHNTPTCNLARDCWLAWKVSDFVGAALVLQDYIIIKKVHLT
jgi:carbamoyltransferase